MLGVREPMFRDRTCVPHTAISRGSGGQTGGSGGCGDTRVCGDEVGSRSRAGDLDGDGGGALGVVDKALGIVDG